MYRWHSFPSYRQSNGCSAHRRLSFQPASQHPAVAWQIQRWAESSLFSRCEKKWQSIVFSTPKHITHSQFTDFGKMLKSRNDWRPLIDSTWRRTGVLSPCRTRRLNQALSVFLSVSLLLTRAPFALRYFCVICVFCLLVVLIRLSVPVQVIDWKESSPKWPIMCWRER